MRKNLYLVGVDGSEWSDRAVERAMHLAQQTGANVQLLHVLTWHEFQPAMLEGVAPMTIDKTQIENSVNEELLQPLIKKYQAEDVTLTSEFLWGDPVEELHQYVKDHNVNMLFVGRRGRSRFVDILVGSVANKLAHQTGVPIVLVP